MDNKILRALVLNYNTKYKEGFTDDEIEDIKNKVEEKVFNFNSEKFWKSFDAINEDLKKYICSWTDIQYYNYYKFKPFDILTNKSDIRTAIIESKKHNKLK